MSKEILCNPDTWWSHYKWSNFLVSIGPLGKNSQGPTGFSWDCPGPKLRAPESPESHIIKGVSKGHFCCLMMPHGNIDLGQCQLSLLPDDTRQAIN